MRDYQLADGGWFSCWTSSQNREGKPCYIWSDCPVEICYRLVRDGKPGDWKPMHKHEVKGGYVDSGKVVRDRKGIPGAVENLPHGRYKLEFKVGEQVFTRPRQYLSVGSRTNDEDDDQIIR